MSPRWNWVGACLLVGIGVMSAILISASGSANSAAAAQQKASSPKSKKGKRSGQNKKGQRKNAARNARFAPAPPTAAEGEIPVLSSGDSYDDFASVAQASDGTLYAAYAAYYDGHDQVRLHKRLEDGQWSTRTHVPLVRAEADIWMPQLAVDAKDRLWVIWCEQTGQSKGRTGNFDLYARALVNDTWGPIVRLTDDPKPDINPHVATDAKRNIHVVWQAHPENTGDIQYCRYDGESWSKPTAVTTGPSSDWYPHVAVDAEGTAWIAFDGYRNGDYDIYLARLKDGVVGETIPVTTSKYYEAHATVACTPDSRVWIAWEQGGYQWGADQGYWLRRQQRNVGTVLGSERGVHLAVYEDGKLFAGPPVGQSLPQARQPTTASPELASGTDGRLWLRFRQRRSALRGRNRLARYWVEQITSLTEDGWRDATLLAGSAGRISVFSRILGTKDGSLAVAYSGDQRTAANYHRPIHDQVMVASVAKPSDPPGTPRLSSYSPPPPPANAIAWDIEQERRQVRAIRAHRVTIDGTEHRIVRGDLHRHTELSWDVGPGGDGSYLDFYRYMIDVASMDFGGLTDHQGGGHYAYWWWLTEKSCDMYYLAPRFVPLYGYERSATFPNGHRNVFHSYRGVPVFPFQTKLDLKGVFPGVGTGALVDNDTKLLYEYLHKTGGVLMSHTSGTATMGTDWRDNDPVIEPVVEIYQGARHSYEALDAPRVKGPNDAQPRGQGGFQEAGLLWKAYDKGYRLGIIASSDHGSTHISYALVYTPKNDREEIIASIRKRHTYGGTGNLIVETWANGRFMGDEYSTREKPALTLKATGTSDIEVIDLVRSGEYIYQTKPNNTPTVEVNYTDMQPKPGTNLYYFRIVQKDGEIAWVSPVWVNYKP